MSVDGTWFYDFKDIDLQADHYSIQQDCFLIERRNIHTLFIKIEANPLTVNRVITVGLGAGDYFDRLTITQKAKK
ncbi:MAG TPA: hypothetical protein VGK10_05225 [Prolixibacteraceae bacterium]